MNTIKILSNGVFTSFNVKNKYRISKAEQQFIFETINVSTFNVTFPKTTHTYCK